MRVSCATLIAILLPMMGMADTQKPVDKSTIVFVCEHGAAKSVIAAAYFNHIAESESLPFRAVARGTTPQPELAQSAVKGLQADEISFPSDKPAKLTSEEVSVALRIVAFCDLPDDLNAKNAEHWEAPAVGEDYSKARDAIVKKVQALVASLKKP